MEIGHPRPPTPPSSSSGFGEPQFLEPFTFEVQAETQLNKSQGDCCLTPFLKALINYLDCFPVNQNKCTAFFNIYSNYSYH